MRLVAQLLGYLTAPSKLDLRSRHHHNGCGTTESYKGPYRVGREAISLTDCCVWMIIDKQTGMSGQVLSLPELIVLRSFRTHCLMETSQHL
jgi:hypothetical protein